VARIATANLTSTAKQKIAALLQNGSCPGASTLADRMACASVWADSVRYTTYPETYNWHFVDISLKFEDYDHERDCEENDGGGDCGIPALANMIAFLKGEQTAPKYKKYSRTNALKFIIHIVGDLHQPLHTVREETGGNFFFVKYGGAASGTLLDCYNPDSGENFPILQEKLHKIWDTCILTEQLRSTNVTKYARNLNNDISGQEKTGYEDGTPTDWLLETHQIAIDNAYKGLPAGKKTGKNRYTTIPAGYYEASRPPVETQLKRAGIRLSKILNDIFDG
jgi:hypothetical protein